jgi:hypothetical protein
VAYERVKPTNWVFNQWQWSVNVYKTRKGTAIYKRRNNTQNDTKKYQEHGIHKIRKRCKTKTNIQKIFKKRKSSN